MFERINYQVALVLALAIVSFGQNCDLGMYHNGQNCVACDSSCTGCINQFLCTACHEQSWLVVRDDRLTCIKCSQLMEGCRQCNSEDTCKTCQSEYQLAENKCLMSQQPMKEVNNLTSKVQKCQSYEIMIEGKCIILHPNCQIFNRNGSCKTCIAGTEMISSYCIPIHLSVDASTIAQQTQSAKAKIKCKQREYIKNDECVAIGQFCLKFLQSGTCLECDTGYILFKGLCAVLGKSNSTQSKKVLMYTPTRKGSKTAVNVQQQQPEQPLNNDRNGIIPVSSNSNPNLSQPKDKVQQKMKAPQAAPAPIQQPLPPALLLILSQLSSPAQPAHNHQTKNHEDNNPIVADIILAAPIASATQQAPTVSNQSSQQMLKRCNVECSTCSDNPSYCLTCSQGYTNVDDPAYAGLCFQL